MSDEQIIYDGYQWREWVQDRGGGWDWAMWEQIQGLANKNGFEYKKELTSNDIFNDPKIPMGLIGNKFQSQIDNSITSYRNNNNKTQMTKFLNTEAGQAFTKLSQRQLWGNVIWDKNEKVNPTSSLRQIGHYKPYSGLQDLKNAKSFEDALNTEVTLYRGVAKNYQEGSIKLQLTSFTTSATIAKVFAEGYLSSINIPGTGKVITMKVPLKDIKGFINPDGEYEVLLRISKTKKSVEEDNLLEDDWLNFLHNYFRSKKISGLSKLFNPKEL